MGLSRPGGGLLDTCQVASIDIADETFVVALPDTVASYISDPQRWQSWFQGLSLSVVEDRGVQGVRWLVTGDVAGTAEIWVEPVGDGVVMHLFLRGELRGRSGPRAERSAASEWALRVKAVAFGIKDALEEGRHRRPQVREPASTS